MSLRIGLAGATGAVGRVICEKLPDYFPAAEIRLLASHRSVGQMIEVQGRQLGVIELTSDNLNGLDLLIASTPDDVARQIATWIGELNLTLVDESAAHRMEEMVPLIVPEVNPHHFSGTENLIASPNCSTTQLVMCLKPLHDFAKVNRVVVSTYQAASGAGSAGESDLIGGSRASLDKTDWKHEAFTQPIAFNVLPRIGSPLENGFTSEEMKMVLETRKILDAPEMEVNATCVRVPVVCGHSESVLVECENPIDAQVARQLFEQFAGISVVDDLEADRYPTPLESSGHDEVFVGRIRNSMSGKNAKNTIAFWCVSDNLRKGAATNALQIAKLIQEKRAAQA